MVLTSISLFQQHPFVDRSTSTTFTSTTGPCRAILTSPILLYLDPCHIETLQQPLHQATFLLSESQPLILPTDQHIHFAFWYSAMDRESSLSVSVRKRASTSAAHVKGRETATDTGSEGGFGAMHGAPSAVKCTGGR